jgi:CRP-like cAMP-binding protein
MERYNFRIIENKWQKYWKEKNIELFNASSLNKHEKVMVEGENKGEHRPSNLAALAETNDASELMKDVSDILKDGAHHGRRLSNHHEQLARNAAEMLQLRLKARKILKQSMFFSGFKLDTVRSIVEKMQRRVFAKNSYICSEGDNSTEFYIIMKGRVRIFHLRADGGKLIEKDLAELGQNESFGESALKPMSRNRSASASAIDRVEVLVLTRDHFVELSAAGHKRMEKIAVQRQEEYQKKDAERGAKVTIEAQRSKQTVEGDDGGGGGGGGV